MNREHKNSLIFFIIIQTLVFLILYKKKVIDLKLMNGGIFIAVLIIVFLFSKQMIPLFRLILRITGKIGSFVFLIISFLVFYIILTPIAFCMKIFGKIFVIHKYDKSAKTYYQEYKPSENIDKQY